MTRRRYSLRIPARRSEVVLLLLSVPVYAAALYQLWKRGYPLLTYWPVWIMAVLLILAGINTWKRRAAIAVPVGLISGLFAVLCIAAAIHAEPGGLMPLIMAVLRASGFFLITTAMSYLQVKRIPPPPVPPLPVAVTSVPEAILKPLPVAAPVAAPVVAKPVVELDGAQAMQYLEHLLEDFVYSRNRAAWSVASASEIAGVVCRHFAESEIMMAVANDLVQYRPAGGPERLSYPAMRPRVMELLIMLRTRRITASRLAQSLPAGRKSTG